MFGGRDSAGCALRDVWTFDAHTGQWCARQPGGALPPPREACAAILCGHTLLVAGGFDAAGDALSCVWALDTRALAWECVLPHAPGVLATATGVGPHAPRGAYWAWEETDECVVLHVLRPDAGGSLCVHEAIRITRPADSA